MLYQPPHFAVAERAVAIELMRRHPLATLISHGREGEPVVSHAPLIAAVDGERLELRGHLAKPNPQWKGWKEGDSVLAVFHGPDAYVSPFCYETTQAVPTWNYAVVHAAGTVVLQHDSAAKERVLKALIDAHDRPYHARWEELDFDWREKMKNGIVAFDIRVTRLDIKFKLGQNRSLPDRQGVLQSMERGDERARGLVEWMRRLMPDL